MTKGSYRVLRTVSYPEFPESEIELDVEVTATRASEWATTIKISGTYDAPTDVVSQTDYKILWTTDGESLLESGTSTLELSSGRSIRCEWTSTITPKTSFAKLPRAGEVVEVSISPFQVDGNKMSYEWEGTARMQSASYRTNE